MPNSFYYELYGPTALKFYDFWVLRLSNSYAWLCPTNEVLLPFFREHFSANHLDVGVGTGFFPSAAVASTSTKDQRSLTLLDLNPNTLAASERRVHAADAAVAVRRVHADATRPLPAEWAGRRFDSVSSFYLLHCLPGPAGAKTAVFGVLRRHVAAGGVLVGATILGKGKGVAPLNWLAWALMQLYNRAGIFDNWGDEPEVFEEGLRREFDEVETRIVGRVLLFKARKPREAGD